MSQLVFIAAMLFGAAFLPSTSLADGRVITNIDGLSLNPSAIGANFISDTGYNTSATDRSNNYVYQAAGKMEFVLRAEFHFSYGVPDGCFLAGETLEVLAVDFVTADAQHAHVSTVDPSTVSVTTNGNVAEIRFPFDPYDPANGGSGLPKRYYEIVPKVTLRGTATYGNLACTPFSPLPYTATLETGLVLFPTKYMETEIDEQDRVVKVKLSSFSLVAANVYLGVGFTEKPVIGEVIRPSSAGGKMIFSPSQAATEEYWGAEVSPGMGRRGLTTILPNNLCAFRQSIHPFPLTWIIPSIPRRALRRLATTWLLLPKPKHSCAMKHWSKITL